MSRRGHNEGTVFLGKDGRWVAEIDHGVVVGSRKRRRYYGKTRSEVAKKLNDGLKARQDGLPQPSERTRVKAFLDTWLKGIEPSVRPRTWMRYEEVLRLHIPDHLGKLPLTKLAPTHLQTLYADRLANGLSPASVVKLHNIIHSAIGHAVRWGLVIRNVADLVDPPRIAKHEIRTLTPEVFD
jgi:hypothetical protein